MSPLMGAKVLITGGLGFIGSNLARALVEADNDVTVVDSLIPEYGGNAFNIAGIEDRLRVNVSDVRDPHSMRHLLRGQDFIFNLAGQTSHLDSMIDPRTDLEINAAAQLSILEACREVRSTAKIIFASTRQIYGKPEYLPVDERHPIRPVDINGVNKLAGEWYHLLYHQVHGIRACCLRLTNTYGPRMRIKDARQTFVGVWIRNLLQGKPIEVWGGGQLRDFNYVEDVVAALITTALAPEADGKLFNLGSREIVSLKALAELMIACHGGGTLEVKEFPPERQRIDIGDYYADCAFIEQTLGWTPQVSLRDGLRQTLDFYREHSGHYLP